VKDLWNEADSARARQIGNAYQSEHDVSAYLGQAVGIDPRTEEVWLGSTAQEIHRKRAAAGVSSPFYCLRVGRNFYLRKGRTK
jgi:hypothetical protein